MHDTHDTERKNEYGGTGGEGSQLLGGLDLLGGLVAALGVSLLVSRGGQGDERVNNTVRPRLVRLAPLHSSTDAALQPRRVLRALCALCVRACSRATGIPYRSGRGLAENHLHAFVGEFAQLESTQHHPSTQSTSDEPS